MAILKDNEAIELISWVRKNHIEAADELVEEKIEILSNSYPNIYNILFKKDLTPEEVLKKAKEIDKPILLT